MATGASPRPSSLRANERSRKSSAYHGGGYGERGVDPHQSTAVTSPAEAQALAEAVGTKLSGGCLAVPWAAHRSARPRQAERPPVAGNPPPRRAPFLGLHAPPGSPGRLLQRAEPPHPHWVTPRGGKQHRVRADLAVRSPDSSREILRAIGVDQHLRTSAPRRTVRLPRHVPDLPTRELPLKLAPTLTVPHGLSPHPRSTRPSPGHVSHRQTRRVSLRHARARRPASRSRRGVLAEAYRNSSGSPTRRARG